MKITDELVDTCAVALINEWREGEGLSSVDTADLEQFVGAAAVRSQARAVLTAALGSVTEAEAFALREGWNRARNVARALDGPDVGFYPYPEGKLGLSLD